MFPILRSRLAAGPIATALVRPVNRCALIGATALSTLPVFELRSQERTRDTAGRDTTLAANHRFEAGSFLRLMMGDNYRDEWTTPVTVPFLDLSTFAGGLRPTETGGGAQTLNLRLQGKDGVEYLFRPVKKNLDLSDKFRHTLVWSLFTDAGSGLHPAAALAATPIMDAVGTLHSTPTLFVMPDDPHLGEFRKLFAGQLGMVEERLPRSDSERAIGGLRIIHAEDLLERINRDSKDSVDARAFLTARLVDMLLNDNDRHADQWRWARPSGSSDAQWVPIARDRDMVFHSREGFLLKIARLAKSSLVTFDSSYANVNGLIHLALEVDRRLLSGLERPVWDSVAAVVVRKINDRVIDEAVHRLPREYSMSFAEISGKLRARRDSLPAFAQRYYEELAKVVDIHGNDADDRATVIRSGEGLVDVAIQTRDRAPYFRRRFDLRETREIRIYLDGGNDVAVVRGRVSQSIPVRIIGGNGTNTLVDSSRVGGRSNPTFLYESGTVTGVRYVGDSADKREIPESRMPFERRPWTIAYGKLQPPQKDRGTKFGPTVSIDGGHGLGVVPRVGFRHDKYGFRHVPYSSSVSADVAYSTGVKGFDLGLAYDKRFESSSFHLPVAARMSQLGVVEFRGFGNNVPDVGGSFFDVRQRQWWLRPALAFSPNSRSDISIGPFLRYTRTDSAASPFLAQQHPYGFSRFAQTGVQLAAHYDTRDDDQLSSLGTGADFLEFGGGGRPPLWGRVTLNASAYPGVLDAQTPYQRIGGVASAYITAPVLTRPVLAVRAGGEKLFGEFPYFDAAFIGGSRSLRTEHRQRFAGDASLYGTTELRVPIAVFPLILPLNIGALGFIDIARVYQDGESPGGWHRGTGAGLWIGVLHPEFSLTVVRTNNPDRRTNIGFGFDF